jgi:hypothetical protein
MISLNFAVANQIVELPKRTKVKILGACGALYSARKLRVLSGEHAGEVWYPAYEFVSRKVK